MGKTFLWVEIIFLLLILAGLPLGAYYSEKSGVVGWLVSIPGIDRWQLQKALIFGFSVAALAFAALRTTLIFEKKREQLFEKAKSKQA
jgi:hypothetical protein